RQLEIIRDPTHEKARLAFQVLVGPALFRQAFDLVGVIVIGTGEVGGLEARAVLPAFHDGEVHRSGNPPLAHFDLLEIAAVDVVIPNGQLIAAVSLVLAQPAAGLAFIGPGLAVPGPDQQVAPGTDVLGGGGFQAVNGAVALRGGTGAGAHGQAQNGAQPPDTRPVLG